MNNLEKKSELRSKILQLESAMLAIPDHMTQEDFQTKHYFAPGLYLREITIPKGVTLTGKIHKTEHMCILSKGDVSVYTEDGIKRIQASTVVHSLPGTKRVMFAHEESVWINCHYNPENEKDIDKIDDLFVVDTFEQFYLGSNRSLDDVLNVLGVTRDALTAISENLSDQIPFPVDPAVIRIGESSIHGKGIFSTDKIKKGQIIAPARIGSMRTPAGRYCNHSGSPNSEMVMRDNGDVDLVALSDIEKDSEVLSDYYLNFANTRRAVVGGK